jgi:putative ABC transport system permease protein
MKYLPLLWAGLWRKPVRTVLTVLSIAVAFLLFGVLHGVMAGFTEVESKLSETRLRVTNRANIFEAMPVAYGPRIAQVQGVREVTYFAIFGGYYQEPKNSFSTAAWDVASFLDVIPQVKVPAEQRDAMLRTRSGALVGAELAERFNWHIGDRVTLHSLLWTRKDGSADWPFDIVGFCNAGPDDDRSFATEMYFNYDYIDSARATGNGTVNQFVVSLEDGAPVNDIAVAIDRLFANSSNETITMNERAWISNAIRQVGNIEMFIESIIGAVLFTLLFLAGNTMSQSVRDRLPEWGVLKALGYTDATVWLLVILESAVLTLIAAAIGLAIAASIFPTVFRSLGAGPIALPWHVCAVGFGLALLLALVSATIPASRARRLSVSEALAGR